MKYTTLAIAILLVSFISYGQDKKDLTVGLSAGLLTSPYYSGNIAEGFYTLDFDYHLAERQILSASFLAGSNRYYDRSVTNYYSVSKGDTTNKEIKYQTFSVMYKYRLVNTKTFSLAVGTGAGIMIHTGQQYITTSNSAFTADATWTDLVFPVRLEADCKLSKHFRLCLIGGFFVHPDFPILAYHAGPRLSYVIK